MTCHVISKLQHPCGGLYIGILIEWNPNFMCVCTLNIHIFSTFIIFYGYYKPSRSLDSDNTKTDTTTVANEEWVKLSSWQYLLKLTTVNTHLCWLILVRGDKRWLASREFSAPKEKAFCGLWKRLEVNVYHTEESVFFFYQQLSMPDLNCRYLTECISENKYTQRMS